MDSYKDQLAAIHPSIKKSDTSVSAILPTSNSKADSQLVENNTYLSLALLGRIKEFDPKKHFGFISHTELSTDNFFHVNGYATNDKLNTSDVIRRRDVIFILGTSPRNGRSCAVKWCFVKDIDWPSGKIPKSQSELDNIRRNLIIHQNINLTFKMLKADWYHNLYKTDKPKAELKDDILEKVLIEKLKKTSPGELKQLHVRSKLELSPYSFAYSWGIFDDKFDIHSLVSNFSTKQLIVFGKPEYKWFYDSKSSSIEAKLFEWAMQCKLNDDEKKLWEKELSDDYPWYEKVALNLVKSNWKPSKKLKQWIKNLVKSNKLSQDVIVERIKSYPDEFDIWFDCLLESYKIPFLIESSSTQEELISFLNLKKNKKQSAQALLYQTLSIDLETDGERIWEIGVADVDGKRLLLSRDDPSDKLVDALKQLEIELKKSKLIIGHNVLVWDWPILKKHLSIDYSLCFWDTLLVKFMLEPWSTTHALGSTHHAHDDAYASLKLFEKQIQQLKHDISLDFIKGNFTTSEELLDGIRHFLFDTCWDEPKIPSNLRKLEKLEDKSKTYVLSDYLLQQLNWVNNVIVVSADTTESIDLINLNIDIELLRIGLEKEQNNDFIGSILLSVLNKAKMDKISVRLGMLPVWIKENENISNIINASLIPPKEDNFQIKVAGFPKNYKWYLEIDTDKFIVVDPPKYSYITDDKWVRLNDLPLQENNEFFHNIKEDYRCGSLYNYIVDDTPSVSVWGIPDVAKKKLEQSGKYWHIFKTINSNKNNAVINTGKVQSIRPKLIAREFTSLIPETDDQASYWKEILSYFTTITKQQPIGTVSILLVVSSSSIELIKILHDALIELDCAKEYMSYHSRFDRLNKVALHKGGALVDLIENWQIWKSLADIANIKICPVIEVLPIFNWYATRPIEEEHELNEKLLSDIDSKSELDDESDPDIVIEDVDEVNSVMNTPVEKSINRIPNSQVTSVSTELVKDNMISWLHHIGFSDNSSPPTILDPRLSLHSKEIRNLFEVILIKPSTFNSKINESLDVVFDLLQIVREDAPQDYETMRKFLEENWNEGKKEDEPGWISNFREATQQPAIDVIRDRKSDVLVTLPTGEGKSVLFQVPALCRGLRTRRLSLVISPLRALMHDQVETLWQQGFHQSADYLSADRSAHEIEEVLQGILDHRIVLLYVAPERLRGKRFIDALERRFESDGAFEYVVIDETHCVNQWGYEFRPDYFFALNTICNKFRQKAFLDKSPFILLSATVTASTRKHLELLIKGNEEKEGECYLPFLSKPDQYFHPIRDHIIIKTEFVAGRINSKPKEDWPIDPRLKVILNLINDAKQNKRNTNQHSSIIIFVSRRDHAEKLSFLIERRKIANVDFFHAGLDAETREDVYLKFKDESIDVLVATKAFGMGMDIPHIHWAVHLAPPTYLEDYLQEVGRIGRGEKERKQADLSKLKAVLLYSDDDFQVNRENIQRSLIEFPVISDLNQQIQKNITEIDGCYITMMPDFGFEAQKSISERRVAITQIRKTLYWLERLHCVEIKSMIPGLLPVNLFIERLKDIASLESGAIADVANVLVSIESRKVSKQGENKNSYQNDKSGGSGIINSIIDGISNFVGFFFGGTSSVNRPENKKEENSIEAISTVLENRASFDAIVNLSQIWREVTVTHIDDVLSILAELEKRGALRITRKISFGRGHYSYAELKQIELLFSCLEQLSKHILSKFQSVNNKYTIDFNDIGIGFPEININEKLVNSQKVLERAVCQLLRGAGLRITERIISDEKREYVARLNQRKYSKVNKLVNDSLKSSKELWDIFIPKLEMENHEIEISKLLEVLKNNSEKKRFREWDLRRNLGVLGALKLIGISEPLIPMSYLLSVDEIGKEPNKDEYKDVWLELEKVNRLNELRSEAMEIFVHLPEDIRDQFIEGYFSKENPEEMELFLDEQVRQVEGGEDGEGSGFIQQKLSHIRATAIEDFFQRYKSEPEEPNQWQAISHPFDQHLIVNAGPGSGKTSVLIARIAHLIRNQYLRPESILVLAFNRAVVFEIRSRIKDLFKQLGYGAYVRRLNVYTFHSFAMMHMKFHQDRTNEWDDDRENLLEKFAEKLESDSVFRLIVAGELKTILVDEFQDMNNDLFRIVQALSSKAGMDAGVMVIGDDDQDILRWNRKGKESSEIYFKRFINEFDVKNSSQLLLKINFRSGDEIVKKSQKLLNNFFVNINENIEARLKKEDLKPSKIVPESKVLAEVTKESSFEERIRTITEKCNELGKNVFNGSTAILCRTNNDVSKVFYNLRNIYSNLEVQNNTNYPISRLRHIGIWCDLLKNELETVGDKPLSDPMFKKLKDMYSEFDIPEVNNPRGEDIKVEDLWGLCLKERSYPYLSYLIRFVESLDSGDIVRLLGDNNDKSSNIIVSTIHKVKGLEFDNVLLVPSLSSFSQEGYSYNREKDSAEEARLFYVGMTRAKKNLCYYWSTRESKWWKFEHYRGNEGNGKILNGKPDEVGISWAWESTSYNRDADDLQSYIEKNVRVGERLELGGIGTGAGRGIFHTLDGVKRQIGYTSKSSDAGNQNSELTVSAVLRCFYNGQRYFSGITTSKVVDQGWGLVVLVSGILR